MEALVDFCRQKTFMVEMYANLDCDITCGNVFEDLANVLSKGAFPVNCPLSTMHILALDGLTVVIQGMAERIGNASVSSERTPVNLDEYTPFWMVKCENYGDPDHWVPFVRRKNYIKRRLMIGADHFNRDPKKGLEFFQGTYLLPEKLDPQSVACFFRYLLGNHDEFCVKVLHEFAGTFDFQDMNLDTALRLFLETFRLPGESQKIQRVPEAFSERYYEQSPQILANKDAALLLSYSLIMLNTDQPNVQVKKKMTEEDFIRNNRHINGGNDLSHEFISELYYSICKNEIYTTPEQGAVADSRAYVDHDMFAVMSGSTIAAISMVFDHAEHEDVYQTCIDGFLAIAKISVCHHLEDVLDDLVVSLCKFTTLLNPSSVEEPVLAFGDDAKARMATITVFTIANRFGDFIRTDWRNILDCILRFHNLGHLPARVASDAADDSEILDPGHGKPFTNSLSSAHMQVIGTPRKTSGLMGRFSQLLSLDTEEPRSRPTEQQLAAHQRTLQTIQNKFLQADSFLQLARALIWADEDTAVFCLELLIAITLNNRDRIGLLWQGVYEHIANIVQSTVVARALVEKAVFGLLCICQRLPNFVLFIDAARQFAESHAGQTERSVQAVDLMAGSVSCLIWWAQDAGEAMSEAEAAKLCQGIGQMWLRLVQALRKVWLDQREEVRNHALLSLKMCLTGVDEICFPVGLWTQCFEMKENLNIEGMLVLALKLLTKVFLHLLLELSQLSSFCKLWRSVMGLMEKYMKLKVKRSEKLQELVPELLKNTLLVMKTKGMLVPTSTTLGGDNVWEQTWLHVNKSFPSLQSEVFANQDSVPLQSNEGDAGRGLDSSETASAQNE
ncbi:hypothetical protein Pfo_009534 [Paulownia fortunei]|nr:hypothetical protein Pfo_009534 [Paulownia fortunei]